MDHQSIEEVPQKLIPAFHVFGVIFISEDGAYLTFGHLEIHQGTDVNYFFIPEF